MSRSGVFLLATMILARPLAASETESLLLSGAGRDDPVAWQIRVSEGRRSGAWEEIPVPANWELQGFGRFDYGRWEHKTPEVAEYRTSFRLPARWLNRRLFLVFEGVMTDATVRLNGAPAGPTHRGGFTRFRYDVTDLVDQTGPNELEVRVAEASTDASVNRAERDADYWVFGGIYRPVRLEARPAEGIDQLAVDARASGRLDATVRADGLERKATLVAWVEAADGTRIGSTARREVTPELPTVSLGLEAGQVAAWTAETPNLYHLRVELRRGDRLLHRVVQRIGFRTVELRPDGLWVNDRRVLLKGFNRHSFWPDSGRTTSSAVSRLDVELLKSLHANAVRSSHYPPDTHFLESCDELGLYVIDELPGWHDAYDTRVGRGLVREMVERDVNHPSVILWANGNEGGWNEALDGLFHELDPQVRPLLHPHARFGGFDARHYPSWEELQRRIDGSDGIWPFRRSPLVVLPTEMLHGLYDGGLGAGIEEYWRALREAPRAAGAFLWALFDEGVVRDDEGGRIDTAGSYAPDGIVGPYRQPEGSAEIVRRTWSPVTLEAIDGVRGTLVLRNRYDHLDLEGHRLLWSLDAVPTPSGSKDPADALEAGTVALTGPPGAEVPITLPLPRPAEAPLLSLTVEAPGGLEIARWQIPRRSRREVRLTLVPEGRPEGAVRAEGTRVLLQSGGTTLEVDRVTGALTDVRLSDGSSFPLRDGPRLLHGQEGQLAELEIDGAALAVTARYDRGLHFVDWRVEAGGWFRLHAQYEAVGRAEVIGLSFGPLPGLEAIRWFGAGPYRVWKNRPGGLLGEWTKAANRTETGRSWEYPEFPGFHAPPYWLVVEAEAGRMTVVFDDELFFHVAPVEHWQGDGDHSPPPFTVPGFALLHAIPPIGTKFHPPEALGPSGQWPVGEGFYRGVVHLRFDPPGGSP